MNRRLLALSLALVSLPVSLSATPSVGDAMYCSLRYYGSPDGREEMSREEWLRKGPLFATDVNLGAVRYNIPDPSHPNWRVSFANANIRTKLGESEFTGDLSLSMQFATELDAAGKPTKGAQAICLMGSLQKNDLYVAQKGDGPFCPKITVLPGGVTSFEFPKTEDPFAPGTHWEATKLDGVEPILSLGKEVFIESQSGSGVLKVSCYAFNTGGGVTPIPMPIPGPTKHVPNN